MYAANRIGVAIVSALAILLAGCGGGGDPTPAPTPAPTPEFPTSLVSINNNIIFTCIKTTACDSNNDAENILMIHGFPLRKESFLPLMQAVTPLGYCAAACDMHGYSPGASPDDKSMYKSDALRKDSFAIAEALGFNTFHLVTHDHGAVLGWRMAGTPNTLDRDKLLSFTSLSIPHLDAMSKGLFGANASAWQQVASQYFTVFSVENSASLNDNWLFNLLNQYAGANFDSPAQAQKALWWYNGIFDELPKLAMPTAMTLEEINASDFPHKDVSLMYRRAFGNGGAGYPQAAGEHLGNIEVPTLFICGDKDTSILCTEDWALTTADYVTAFYEYHSVDCGHSLLDCQKQSETQQVITKIISFLDRNKARREVFTA